jgi:hypothetical protein
MIKKLLLRRIFIIVRNRKPLLTVILSRYGIIGTLVNLIIKLKSATEVTKITINIKKKLKNLLKFIFISKESIE